MFQTPSSSAQIAAEAHKNEQGMALFSELARLMLVVFFYAPFTAPNMQLGDVGPHRSIRLTPSALLRRMRSPSPPHWVESSKRRASVHCKGPQKVDDLGTEKQPSCIQAEQSERNRDLGMMLRPTHVSICSDPDYRRSLSAVDAARILAALAPFGCGLGLLALAPKTWYILYIMLVLLGSVVNPIVHFEVAWAASGTCKLTAVAWTGQQVHSPNKCWIHPTASGHNLQGRICQEQTLKDPQVDRLLALCHVQPYITYG